MNDILVDLSVINNELLIFEQKYNISSILIYSDYVGGVEPENEDFTMDFVEWGALYQMKLCLMDKLKKEV